MQNMKYYYDFSGQKFGHPLSLSVNGFARQVFSQQSSLEISYVLQGEYDVITPRFSRTIRRHELAVIAPNDVHMITQHGRADCVILTVHIDFDRIPETMAGGVRDSFVSMVCTACENTDALPRFQKALGRLVCLLRDRGSLFQLNAAMMELAHLASSRAAQPMDALPLHSVSHQSYMRAVQFINEHYREELQLADVAKQLSFSESYTSRIFKKYVGVPFVKYLAYVRVRASLEALLEGRENIEKIALDCGMPNAKSYAAVFREMYGILPSTYRRQFLKNLRYTGTNLEREMALDDGAAPLLEHLAELAESSVYEDDFVSVSRCGGAVVCSVREGACCEISQKDGRTLVTLRPKE